MHPLPAREPASKLIPFSPWVPYLVAAGLMILGVYQAQQIQALKARLLAANGDVARLRQSNALVGLRLATLEAKNVAYLSAKVIAAWDSHQDDGVVSVQNLFAPPTGHVYQLWVLDPEAEAPINAGLIPPGTGSRRFTVGPVSTPAPGFAISLEPSGGGTTPTGPILFAVAPGE